MSFRTMFQPKIYTLNSSGKNYLSEVIAKRIASLETHQTARLAKEFYQTVFNTLRSQGARLPDPFLFEKRYFLSFKEDPSEVFGIVLRPDYHKTAIYTRKDEKVVAVEMVPAYRIPGLARDIQIGRTRPSEDVPFHICINDKNYPIDYRIPSPFLTRIGFS